MSTKSYKLVVKTHFKKIPEWILTSKDLSSSAKVLLMGIIERAQRDKWNMKACELQSSLGMGRKAYDAAIHLLLKIGILVPFAPTGKNSHKIVKWRLDYRAALYGPSGAPFAHAARLQSVLDSEVSSNQDIIEESSNQDNIEESSKQDNIEGSSIIRLSSAKELFSLPLSTTASLPKAVWDTLKTKSVDSYMSSNGVGIELLSSPFVKRVS